MAKEFFKQVPPDEWEKLKKEGRAERYDERELRHVRGMEGALTGERLLSTVDEKKRQELAQAAKSIEDAAHRIYLKIQASPEKLPTAQEVLEIKDALSVLENAQKPTPQNVIKAW